MRETICLVPGLLCDGIIWEHQRRTLATHYDVMIPDLSRQSSIGQMAMDILANAPPRFSIAGHSMGARVALDVVARAPERILRIALLDTGVHPATAEEPRRRQELLDISAGAGMRALADRWLPPMVKDGTLMANPALRQKLYAMVERMSPQIHQNQIRALLDRPDAHAQLSKIDCPVLIGVGEQDRWSPPAQHEAIAAAIPHARYVVFPESGHMAPIEAAEAVTEALQNWLNEPLQAWRRDI